MSEEKKEVQGKIITLDEKDDIITEEEINSVLRRISPGTHMRTALEGALKIGKGALIAVENEKILPIIDGGFKVNCRFTPQKLMELTKMDGAIIISRDFKKILYANVMLTPSAKIKTHETGTRHRTAERTAKQIEDLVIAISERKNEINMYYKKIRYKIKPTDEVLREATSQMQILEKHKEIFDNYILRLTKAELRNIQTLSNAIKTIQKGKTILKISGDLKRKIIETGEEGILIKIRLKEILEGIEKETDLIIKDYTKLDLRKSKTILDSLSYEEIMEDENIIKLLDYESISSPTKLKGWRVLSKTSLEELEINILIKELGGLSQIIHSNMDRYKEILDPERAKTFKEEVNKIKFYQGKNI